MSYDKVKTITYTLDNYDFGATADESFSFRLPTGYTGRLVKIGVMVTEAFVSTSTNAFVQLGTASDDDAYGQLEIANGAADVDCYDETDDTDAIIDEDIPADTLLEVNLLQAYAGSPTGKGNPFFVFEIFE